MRRRLPLLLILVELLACLGDLLLGPYGRVHWEERFNARAGVQLACGHIDEIFQLQYVSFCGGCTAEALMAVPLFTAVGPTVLAWKAVPLAFHAVVLGSGAWLAARATGADRRGRRAALSFVLLLMAAPGYYRELVLTGWGNHAESSAFPLLAAVMLVAATRRGLLAKIALCAGAGLVAGAGAWFGHTSTWGLPALLLLALLVSPVGALAFLAAIPVGFSPWKLYFQARPDQTERTLSWALDLQLAPVGRYLDWLFGPYLRWGLWDPSDYGQNTGLEGIFWVGFWVLAGLGLCCLLRRWSSLGRHRRRAALFLLLSPVALLVAYLLRFDLWAHLPEVPSQPTLGLRYRAPLIPLMGLLSAVAVGRRVRGARLVLALLVAFGLGQRLSLWRLPPAPLEGLRVYAHDGWRDRSVPLGEPLQRLPRRQGRPQDIAAAVDFLHGHDDRFPDCRLDHLFELGRRVGLAVARRGPGALDAWREELADIAEDPYRRWFLAEGAASVVVSAEGEGLATLTALLPRLPEGLRSELGRAAGRQSGRHISKETSLEASIQAGVCEVRGRRWVEERPGGRGGQLAKRPPTCADPEALWWGAGWAASREVGCEESDLGGLFAEDVVDDEEALRAGWRFGCGLLRVGVTTQPRGALAR